MKINKKLYDNLSQFLIYFVKHLSLTLLFVAYGTGSASARNDLLDNTSLFRIAKWASDFPMYIGSNSTGGYASFSIFQSNYTDSCIGTGPCNAESAKWLMPASELRDVKISFDYEIVFDAQFQVTDSVMVGFSPSVTGSGSSYITASPGSNTATGSRQYTLQDGYLEIILAGYNGQAVGNTELRITNFIADYAPKLQPILYDTGDFTSYDEVQFTLDFDQDISVSGSPRILLDVGGQQKYATLADCYVVQANRFCANYYVIEGDLDSDGIEIISIDLNGGTVVGVNNSLDASLSFSSGEIPVYIDAVAPIANFENFGTIPSQVNSFTNIPIEVSFSENVNSFNSGDVTVTNGSVSNFVGTGSAYSFDVIPSGNGDLVISLSQGFATDALGNAYVSPADLTIGYDGTAPTVRLTSDANSPHSGVFTVTATFSEAVTGFVLGDVTVGNGSASNFQTTSASVYTFDVTPTADGAVTVDVAAEVATDTASNNNTAAEQLSVTTDSTVPAAPTVSVANATTLSGTAEANAAVTIYASNGTTVLATTTADGSGNWSLTNPLSDGQTGSVKATDAAGNTSPATAIAAVDGTAPTVALTTTANSPHSGVFTVTATFSEAVTGFALEDITVGNGTAANLAGSGTTYTFDVTPTTDGAVTVDIAADVAQDAATNGNAAATQLSVTTDGTAPTVEITGPDEIVTAAFDVTIEFSEVVTGLELSEVAVVNGAAIELTGSGTTYVARIDPVMGQTVEVSLAAGVAVDGSGNPNSLSNVYQVLAGSPASEFEKYSEEIRQVLVDEAQRSLRSTISANQNLVRGARQRVMEDQRKAQACLDQAVQGDAVRPLAEDQDCIDIADQSNQVPFDVDGIAQVSGSSMMTSGSFFEQSGDGVETTRRLFFGDFDIQHDGESVSTTATLNARIAWEDMLSNQTMFGYFVGGSLANSNIAGAFDGTNTKVGVDAGVYAVHQLEDALYLDGFATLGIGQNDLEMANDVLALESDYTTKTATIGASLSGVIMENGLELHPELAVSYGKTWLGDVGFTGRAYGLTDDTPS
jgi:hypothetical protein